MRVVGKIEKLEILLQDRDTVFPTFQLLDLSNFVFELDVYRYMFSKTRNIFLDIIYVEVILTG